MQRASWEDWTVWEGDGQTRAARWREEQALHLSRVRDLGAGATEEVRALGRVHLPFSSCPLGAAVALRGDLSEFHLS